MNRRDFLKASAVAAIAGRSVVTEAAAPAASGAVRELVCSEPMLQAPAETTMGVVWAVGAMATGAVEVSEHADFSLSRTVATGTYGVNGFDDKVLSVRLTGLKPATRYWYRTRTTRLNYASGGYQKSLGETVTSRPHSFVTAGASGSSHFAMINDTHMDWTSFGFVAKKLRDLHPAVAIWNGDALNQTDTIDQVVTGLLAPKVETRDYAAEIPILFNNGNHEYRGLFMRDPSKVILPRLASERRPEDELLVRNFAVRYGDVALIGLDTGEDKPDDHPWHAGLCNCDAYRVAQTRWLEHVLARPDIASAPFVVPSFHIPLVPRASEANNPMWWSRLCANLWTPIFNRFGVQVVLVGHMHEYRCTPPDETRSWAQIEGGGYERRFRKIWTPQGMKDIENPGLFPTVTEGEVVGGKLVITVYDVWRGTVAGRHEFAPRAV